MQFILTTQHIGFHDEFSVHTVITYTALIYRDALVLYMFGIYIATTLPK